MVSIAGTCRLITQKGKAVNVNFAYWSIGEITPEREQLAREARWLLFALMWLRKGAPLSLGTLRNYRVLIKLMARFSEDTNRSLFDLLGNEKQLWQFVDARCSGWTGQTLGSLLPLYVAMDLNGARYRDLIRVS
ncbi:hypothetical protein [Rhodoferax sp.]|uniref:hypothetical protein n=1 Tax=Rhodoferax sp. TaxID=50421 RepID=UPI002ACE4001|nr:hypothetical protein [Rhodoferax sp.]MDZ7921695.1 hypothetical protein [Rhodoferax sp.]